MTDALATQPSLRRSSTPQDDRVGIDPLPAVTLMEDHDEALWAWQRGNFSNRILLHIDAHIDFNWIPERSFSDLLSISSPQELEALTQQKIFWNFTDRGTESFVHIGNYICPALRQGLLRAFYWATPEAPRGVSWEKEMGYIFREFRRNHPEAFTDIRIEGTKAQATLYGFPLIVCTLQNLPTIEEEVLLDIDTDFLISGFLEHGDEDPRCKKPWLFPENVVDALRSKGIRSDCVTIAYSVEGGFTPLPYKYFGDALAQLIRDPSAPNDAYHHKRSAQAFEEEGKVEETILEYRKALGVNPKDAASFYNLSLLFLKRGEKTEASRLYREAVSADPTYATAYNNFGPAYQNLGQWKKAEEEYKKILTLDPNHAHALCGLGHTFRAEKDFSQALFYYEEALSKNPRLATAYYGIGSLFFEQGEWDRALSAFRKSLELKGPEAILKFWIGSAFLKKKESRLAKENLLEAARLGFHPLLLHLRLFWIYFREGLTYKMGREARKILFLLWLETKNYFLRLIHFHV
ncbi:MAG: UPF0489 family protein [Candidatus Omnitrophica bacterium]|nr:UPF0489 family protein [Candidatus Omnitrophota bacterium]